MERYSPGRSGRIGGREDAVMDQRNAVHIISHTHWDREWYLTQEQYRIRLVDLIDNLIDLLESDAEFRFFHLDGQTIVLDDYAAVRPSRMPMFRHLVREGRILIGPWYEQNDLFLTSGESTVRSLMEGIRTARELGGEMRVGYLPDHFGLIGQMPQLFRLVGIDNCLFGRGYDIRKHGTPRFRWVAPDGSSVLAVLMTYWYNNAQRFPEDNDALRSRFGRIMEREEAVSSCGPYLLMNGVDHLEAQENLSSILKRLQADFGGRYRIAQSTMPSYFDALRRVLPEAELPDVHGELREAGSYHILNGTLSARVYLKQANDRCGDLIEKWLEPLSVWCGITGLEPVDREYMRFLWKLFMENHPHDSICGCSQDAVHEHMMDRYKRVTEIAEGLIDRKLTLIAGQIDETGFDGGDLKLVVANMSALDVGTGTAAVSSRLAASVYFLAEDRVRDFAIVGEDGTAVPYQVAGEEECRILVLSPINLPGVVRVRRFDIELAPSVPAYGYTCYRVVHHQPGMRLEDEIVPRSAGAPVLENEHLRVHVHENGRFDVLDKDNGRVVPDAGRFHDVTDEGDLYVSVPYGEARVWDAPVEMLSARECEASQECRYRFAWRLPADLRVARAGGDSGDGDGQAGTSCEITVTLRLDRGARAVTMRVEVYNRAKDHRLRVSVPTGDGDRIWAGGQFEVVDRAFDAGREWQRSSNGHPFWKWVAARRGRSGVAIYAIGLHEYELVDDDSRLAVTLLRGVETVNLREETPLETDRQILGQCLGRHSFELAIRPFDDESPTRLAQEAELFHMGLRTRQAPVCDTRWFQGRSWVQDSAAEGSFRRPDPNAGRPRWPRTGRLLALDAPLLLTAVKWHETADEAVVRLVNLDDHETAGRLSFCAPVGAAHSTNLLEETIAEAEVTPNGAVAVRAKPAQIVTIAARFADRPPDAAAPPGA